MEIKFTTNIDGERVARFEDRDDMLCELSENRAADDDGAICLGAVGKTMLLLRDDVEVMLPYLKRFVATGKLQTAVEHVTARLKKDETDL